MSQNADDLWGLPLQDYCENLSQQTPSEDDTNTSAPSRDAVESASKKIYARSPLVSCSTFQDVLGVAAYPDEVLKLAEEGNQLSSCCIKLLQDYAKKCGGLFYYQYGYMGLRVLVLSLLISFERYACHRKNTAFEYKGDSLEELVCTFTVNAAKFLSYRSTVITGIPLNTQDSSDVDSLGFLMSWKGIISKSDRSALLSLLHGDRYRFLSLVHYIPDTQGWMLLLLALWISVVPECELTKPKAFDSLKQLNKLNDILGRYCLAATNDRTLVIAHAVWRWMYFILLPLSMHPEHYPATPSDMDQIPTLRELVVERFKSPLREGDESECECDPTDAGVLSVLLGHLNGYQVGSIDASDDSQLPLIEAMFSRLWAELESDRPLCGLKGRDDVHKLTEVVFRGAMGTISNIERMLVHRKTKTVAELRRLSTLYAAALYQADLVDLVGCILLLPLSPMFVSGELTVIEDIESALKCIGPGWCQIIGCDFMLELLKGHHKRVLECFDNDYTTWLKVLGFIQAQDRSTSHCKRFFDQCQETWEKFGKALGFLTRNNRRCAYTGCTDSISMHSEPLLCCSGCLNKYYCSNDCQSRAWEIRDSASHRLECSGISTVPGE
ncbi:hypothetical protein FRC12_014558 [Ceratobasidium sp. 428]|nr:hypothetical protein FRC12_014558 [Ceratobasidium sp. 428]